MIHKPLLVGPMLTCTSTVAIVVSIAAATPAAVAQGAAATSQAQKAAAKKRDQEARSRKADSPKEQAPRSDTESSESGEVTVTAGVRNSLARARETKRNSANIVDVVDAEDIGKLPNNTVGDVIAMLPGIDAFRREGEVDDIKLRGLDGIQTTVGGTPIESGGDRVASIADLPADLVKSVEVHKTRSPDQVEGAGAGTINIELRKPNEFKKGMTVSVNTAQRYNTQSRKLNQVFTGIANYRRETSIGDIGIMVGATLNRNPFLDSRAHNDWPIAVDPRQVVGAQILPHPTYGPRQVRTVYVTGERKTPSFNGALQWSNQNNSIALEGSYSSPKFDRINNEMYLPILTSGLGSNANALPALSDIVLIPGTNRMESVTVTPTTPIQAISTLARQKSTQYIYRISANHNEELYDFKTRIALSGGKREIRTLTLRNRFVTRPTYEVAYNTEEFGFPQMNTKLLNINMLDPKEYRFYEVADDLDRSNNRTIETGADLKLRPPSSFIDNLQFGVRFTSAKRYSRGGGRTASNYQVPLSEMPGGYGDLVPIAKGFAGTGVKNAWQWLGYDRDQVWEDYDDLRAFATTRYPLFASEEPAESLTRQYIGNERSIAAYGNVVLKTKLIFPVQISIGARVSNWIAHSLSFRRRGSASAYTYEPQRRRSNVLNVEPTATAKVKFTDDLGLRVSYNIGIRRPTFAQLSPSITFNESALTASGGNPDLQPEKIKKLDAIIEYYPGKLGVFTINPFYWKRDGTITNFTLEEQFGELIFDVSRPYNTGKGYKRGVETQAQMFFTFLPGILKNLGINANYTYTETEIEYLPIPGALNNPPAKLPELGVPKHLLNVTGLFERGTLSARVGFSYTGSMLDLRATANGSPAQFSSYFIPRKWVDAQVSYSIPRGPLKDLGISIQAQNVFGMARRTFYGYPDTPRDTWYNARTFGGSIRYKF